MAELSRREVVGLGALGLLAAACGSSEKPAAAPASDGASPSAGATSRAATPTSAKDVAVDPPTSLKGALYSNDVLIYGQNTLDPATIQKISDIKGVVGVATMSMGQIYVDELEVTYAAVDPATFWRYTQPGTAQTMEVWKRVAAGEIAVEPAIGKKVQREDGYMRLGNETAAQEIHIGAYAQLLNPLVARRIDAIVNDKWAERLGMQPDNALLLATSSTSPQSIRKKLQSFAGKKASVQILGPDLDIGATQTAFLTGGNVAAAVGSFSYTANPDGTVNPDPAWVSANIRTEQMPIIGRVTGHRVMLPQLRGALNQIIREGRASSIRTYDGCYVPRFIAKTPSRGLSFHTYGTAIDLNASTNYRGIAGDMDRQVVRIFKQWGFAWGGDWNYTDPMHFELASLAENR